MITLIIETSTDRALIAFAEQERLLLTLFLPIGNQSSRLLMSTIASGLKQLACSVNSLSYIAVGVGPGSYTGIRVGAAVAYGLAFPRKVPLVSLCSLEGFTIQSEGRFASIIDARIGGAYVLLREKISDGIRSHSSPCLVAKEQLSEYLKEYPAQAGPHLSYPDAAYLARLTHKQVIDAATCNHLDLVYIKY